MEEGNFVKGEAKGDRIGRYSREDLKEFMFKEVDIIQNIINRLSHNSFVIKGWTITLITAVLLLKGSKFQIFIAYIPLLAFWFLDAYFLKQERLYRHLYNWVIQNRLETDEYLFNMDANRFSSKEPSILGVMFSTTLMYFYAPMLILLFLIFIFTQKGGGY